MEYQMQIFGKQKAHTRPTLFQKTDEKLKKKTISIIECAFHSLRKSLNSFLGCDSPSLYMDDMMDGERHHIKSTKTDWFISLSLCPYTLRYVAFAIKGFTAAQMFAHPHRKFVMGNVAVFSLNIPAHCEFWAHMTQYLYSLLEVQIAFAVGHSMFQFKCSFVVKCIQSAVYVTQFEKFTTRIRKQLNVANEGEDEVNFN
jgi:hypothetical protein